MTKKEEVLAILKYTLDLRLNGNRCPMTFGVHSDIYSKDYNFPSNNVDLEERQMVLREFIDYALAKSEVRIVSMKKLLEWMRKPAATGN